MQHAHMDLGCLPAPMPLSMQGSGCFAPQYAPSPPLRLGQRKRRVRHPPSAQRPRPSSVLPCPRAPRTLSARHAETATEPLRGMQEGAKQELQKACSPRRQGALAVSQASTQKVAVPLTPLSYHPESPYLGTWCGLSAWCAGPARSASGMASRTLSTLASVLPRCSPQSCCALRAQHTGRCERLSLFMIA